MTDKSEKIAIVTGARDEENNLPEIFKYLLKEVKSGFDQFDWYICVNDSVDRSLDFVKSISDKYDWIHNCSKDFGGDYSLGFKTSSINNYLFEMAGSDYGYYSICDADIVPERGYFYKLKALLDKDKKIGLISGVPDKLRSSKQEVVFGNCRLWNKECFYKARYPISMSADSISLQRARMKGFFPKSVYSVKFSQRDYGERVNYSYYGYSAAYRGVSPSFVLLKFIKMFFSSEIFNSFRYVKGYLRNYIFDQEYFFDDDLRKFVKKDTSFKELFLRITGK